MPKTILIVDDSRSIRSMVRDTLESAGYEVVEAVDGKDGLIKSKTAACQVVVTDQNMPNMDGLTFITELKKQAGYQSVPVLMLTTEASDDMKNKGKTAGAKGWLVKPFNSEKLLKVIRMVI